MKSFLFICLFSIFFSYIQADINCITNSSDSSCSSYVYNSDLVNADVKSLCEDMPFMIGCSILNICLEGNANGVYCSNMSILLDICLHDPQMEKMNGCKTVNQLCKSNSVVSSCTSPGALPNIIGTYYAQDKALSLCQTKSTSIPSTSSSSSLKGCDNCNSITSCSNPLLALKSECQISSASCDKWEKMCKTIPKEMNSICYDNNTKKNENEKNKANEKNNNPNVNQVNTLQNNLHMYLITLLLVFFIRYFY